MRSFTGILIADPRHRICVSQLSKTFHTLHKLRRAACSCRTCAYLSSDLPVKLMSCRSEEPARPPSGPRMIRGVFWTKFWYKPVEATSLRLVGRLREQSCCTEANGYTLTIIRSPPKYRTVSISKRSSDGATGRRADLICFGEVRLPLASCMHRADSCGFVRIRASVEPRQIFKMHLSHGVLRQ